MINHILVPLDGSALAECVLPHVKAVAGAFGSKVTLLSVQDPLRRNQARVAIDPVQWQLQKAEAEAYLEKVATGLRSETFQAETLLMEGRAAETIVEYVRSNPVDLIVLSSHGQSGISGWNISSVVQKIIHRAHTSIFIIPAYQSIQAQPGATQYRRMMVPLDGSKRSESVLPLVATLANTYDVEVMLVHIVRKPEIPRRTPPTEEDQQLVQRLIEHNRIEALEYLDEVQGRLQARSITRLMIGDNVTPNLQKTVDQEEVDLIVLCAHGYSGETRWPYGSVVIGLLAYGTRPLIVYQDVPKERIAETTAEAIAQEHGGR